MTTLDVESVLDKLVVADSENRIQWSIDIENKIYAIRNGVTVTLLPSGFMVSVAYYHCTGNELKYNALRTSAYNKAQNNTIDKFLE